MNDLNLIARTAAMSAVLAGTVAAVHPASAAVPGIADSNFQLVANEAFSSQPDGGSVYSWGYGCASPTGHTFVPAAIATASCGTMQIPGPTLVVDEGQVVTVTLTNNLPVAAGNTSILFPGFSVCTGALTAATATAPATCTPAATPNGVNGVLTQEAVHGGSVTYSFVATKPGTYAYYSGTQADLQVEMGMYGAVVVLPTQTGGFAACNKSANLGIDYRLSSAGFAFDHPQTCYDREYLFQLAEMQSSIHDEALVQKTACDAAIAGAGPGVAVTCPVIAVHSEPYHPNYFLVNGRSMPDDMEPNYAAM
ncbi:MAG: multicopper oxidase domain-containing protein, partial [Pseudomonadota bacterium]|nr:multicopper oxidase domain-containing protein [Pseudomonadota bacterium]